MRSRSLSGTRAWRTRVASAAAIAGFQRLNNLKPDGLVSPDGPTIKVLNGYLPLPQAPETIARAPMYEAAALNRFPDAQIRPGRPITAGGMGDALARFDTWGRRRYKAGPLSEAKITPAMTKRLKSKYKLSRRLGENLWGRPKSPTNQRDYGPGQHGPNAHRRRRRSNYATQLIAKQKLRGYYGNITERQFRKHYTEAVRRRGDTSENLIGLLERRLDAVVYRLKFVPTVFASRQFINHGHVRVNGKRVNIPSYQVSKGDVIEVKEKSCSLALVLEAVESREREVPDYIEADHQKMRGTFLRTPSFNDVPYPVRMEPNLVIEYYSR